MIVQQFFELCSTSARLGKLEGLLDSSIPTMNDMLGGGLEVFELGMGGSFELDTGHVCYHVSDGMAVNENGKIVMGSAEFFQRLLDASSGRWQTQSKADVKIIGIRRNGKIRLLDDVVEGLVEYLLGREEERKGRSVRDKNVHDDWGISDAVGVERTIQPTL